MSAPNLASRPDPGGPATPAAAPSDRTTQEAAPVGQEDDVAVQGRVYAALAANPAMAATPLSAPLTETAPDSGADPVPADLLARLLALLPPGQVLRFAAVGVTATATHFAVLWLGVERGGLAPALANGLAFLVAVCVTYLGQSLWVFGVANHSVRQIRRFLTSATGGLVANVALMAALVELAGLDYRVGFVAVTILVPLGTFLINKFWVFRHGGR